MKFFIILSTFIISTNLYASDWITVSESENVKVYVDKESISRDKNIIKAWTMYIYDSSTSTGNGIELNQSKSLNKFN